MPHEGRRFPTSKGNTFDDASAALASTIRSRHVGLGPRFVNENNVIRIDLVLCLLPVQTLGCNIGRFCSAAISVFFRLIRILI